MQGGKANLKNTKIKVRKNLASVIFTKYTLICCVRFFSHGRSGDDYIIINLIIK